jgi:hypothetical protein
MSGDRLDLLVIIEVDAATVPMESLGASYYI